MKKVLMILAIAGLFSVQAAHAQKYGHVNSSEILEVMPGIDSLQIKLQAFQQDLQTMYENMMSEYQTKKDKFDREVGTMSSAVRQVREKELMDLGNRIQEFQASAQDDLEEKQYELAKPFQDAIQEAKKAAAKRAMLRINCSGFTVHTPKVSGVTSKAAAAAISPTTASLSTDITVFMTGLSLCFKINRPTINISKNGRRTTEKEAKNAPITPQNGS